MVELLKLQEFEDPRGILRVLNELPFEAKRVYFIDKMKQDRGGHRHKVTRQFMMCLRGSVEIFLDNGRSQKTITLNNPAEGLLIEPEDWHLMRNATDDCLIMVLASEVYLAEDYINERYV